MKDFAYRIALRIANEPKLLVGCIVADQIICGLLYALIERHGPIAGMWWATVTGSTVGYGDQYPVTTAGRFVGVVCIWTTILFVAIATAQLSAKLIVDSNAFTDDEQEELKHNIRVIAELLSHVQDRSCLCIWDRSEHPLVVNPQCSVHGSEDAAAATA